MVTGDLTHGWLASFAIWIVDGLFDTKISDLIGSADSMIGSMLVIVEQKLGDAVNEFLAEQIPVEAQATCGEECNLPKGVTIGYAVNNMTIHGDPTGPLQSLLTSLYLNIYSRFARCFPVALLLSFWSLFWSRQLHRSTAERRDLRRKVPPAGRSCRRR